jgi:uncharacterized damage-inducible protein DinB
MTAQPMAESTGDPYIDLMVGQVAFAGGRFVQLAEAIPEDDYSWKPSEGVRTTAAVAVHVLSACYFIPSTMGAKIPDGITRDLESTLTDKTEIIKRLKESMESASDFLKSYDTANFDKMVKTPFGEFSQRMMILILNNHIHEHLGQLIAYARSNNVTPPWSQTQEED